MTKQKIKIGGASGFWGDASRATSQLLKGEDLDFIVYDYLAEITMSIMARARSRDDKKGYATDFVTAAMQPNLKEISKQGVRILANAGGVNPAACADHLRQVIAQQGLSLKVAAVLGDDLMPIRNDLAAMNCQEMFSDEAFPDVTQIQSINAYLGAFPIVEALSAGADIVITGRSVDSAVTLAACTYSFGWQMDDYDRLAAGSLAGHILECGPQATGGNFTDWQLVKNLENIGYPIAEIETDGSFVCTKPKDTGGLVSVATVAEQMLYEIGDPQAYMLPDVCCDFSQVQLTQVGEDRVLLQGAQGRGAPSTYKVSSTYMDGFRGGTFMCFYGYEAEKKARAMSEAIINTSKQTFKQAKLSDFTEVSVELIGAESQYGDFSQLLGSREVAMKLAVKHPQAAGVGILLREAVGLSLATPPGLCGFQGARPKPSPVVRLFSFLLDKEAVTVSIDIDGSHINSTSAKGQPKQPEAAVAIAVPELPANNSTLVAVPLYQLAWGRSGDKGDKANIGIIARQASWLPYICASLTTDVVTTRFAHFLQSTDNAVERFILPGSNALNFLLHRVLGGGGMASIRNDAQGKGYAQLLLDCPIMVPTDIAKSLL